jgi:hypothetical protein
MGKLMDLEKIVDLGTQIGVRTALEFMKKEKEEKRKSRYDRRLRNTKLLLRKYRMLVLHSEESVNSGKVNKENAIDILDQIEEMDENLFIESISRSRERTEIIIAHIKKMVYIFKVICEKSPRQEEKRKYRVIDELYLQEEEKSINDLAAELFCDVRTIYRDVNDAVDTLSALIFGIDGLNISD